MKVYNFRVWDQIKGEMVVPPLKSPADRIKNIRGELIEESVEEVPESALDAYGRYNPFMTD